LEFLENVANSHDNTRYRRSVSPVPNSKDHAAVPPTPSSSRLQYSIDHSPPTEEEVRTSVPHPNAYYCPKGNGCVILSWNASVAPPRWQGRMILHLEIHNFLTKLVGDRSHPALKRAIDFLARQT
jgi:hypothetical protein